MGPIDVVVAFFTEAPVDRQWPLLTEPRSPRRRVGGVAKTGGVRTGITEMFCAQLLPSGWVDNKVCAIDNTWSGLRFVLRKENRPPWKR